MEAQQKKSPKEEKRVYDERYFDALDEKVDIIDRMTGKYIGDLIKTVNKLTKRVEELERREDDRLKKECPSYSEHNSIHRGSGNSDLITQSDS